MNEEQTKNRPIYLEQRFERLEAKVDRLLELMGDGDQLMSVADIAKHLGVSRQTLYKSKRYLLPNFGRDQEKRYPRSLVMDWLAKGEANLYREWKQLP